MAHGVVISLWFPATPAIRPAKSTHEIKAVSQWGPHQPTPCFKEVRMGSKGFRGLGKGVRQVGGAPSSVVLGRRRGFFNTQGSH